MQPTEPYNLDNLISLLPKPAYDKFIRDVNLEIARRKIEQGRAQKVRKVRYVQPYHFYGSNREALKSHDRQFMLHGPAETGKTIAMLWKAHIMCWNNPGVQGAFIRKIRQDMTGSVIQSFEQKILPSPTWSNNSVITSYGGKNPERYIYPNGSQIWIGGIDRPGAALSAERDFVYVNQAEQLNLDDWQTLITRTTGRAGVFSPGYLFGDCNPGPSSHWIMQLAKAGVLKLFKSEHEFNPFLFEQRTGEKTQQGHFTMESLDSLQGVTRDRLKDGLWTSAEGVVYDTWDAQTHIVSKDTLLEWGIFKPSKNKLGWKLNRDTVKHVVAGVDWGFTNPGSILVAAVDSDGRIYIFREIYKPRQLIEYWEGMATMLDAKYGVEKWFCDPSNPAHITRFKKRGLTAVGANNEIEAGINRMNERLAVQPGLKARFYLYEDALVERDEFLVRERKRPIGLAEEMETYIYPPDNDSKSLKEIPLDQHNHSCFIAGTLVQTEGGEIPIEHIKVGQKVLTRFGYRPVIAAFSVGVRTVATLSLSNGTTITGTLDHPIYLRTHNGFCPLRGVRYGDIIMTSEQVKYREVISCRQELIQSSLTGLSLIATLIQNGYRISDIIGLTRRRLSEAWNTIIAKYGKPIMAKSQKVSISTTLMKTRLTMTLAILSAFHGKNICAVTRYLMNVAQRSKTAVLPSANWQANGIDQKQGEHGIQKCRKNRGASVSLESILVNNAAQSTKVNMLAIHDSAQTTVKRHGDGIQASMMKHGDVGAAQTLSSINMQRNGTAPVSVRSVTEEREPQKVYNITVDAPVGEYVANGMLVKNCDGARYIVNALETSMRPRWRGAKGA